MYVKKTDKIYHTRKSFLARCRKKAKISVLNMAHLMGCSVTNVYDIEQKPLDRTLYSIKKYCAVLGLDWVNVLYCLDLEYKPLDAKCKPSNDVTLHATQKKSQEVKDYVVIGDTVVRAVEDKGE